MEALSIEWLNNILRFCIEDRLLGVSGVDIKVPFELKAKDFLKFAECDLSSDSTHQQVNALSNIKRAIECQLDSLLFGFGLFRKSEKENWSFPHKIECLNKVGVISPSILKRINKKRVLLEHKYESPEKEQVEDALDVATLFVEYTNRFLFNVVIRYTHFNYKDEGDVIAQLFYKEGKIVFKKTNIVDGKYLRYIDNTNKEKLIFLTKEVTADSEEYLDYLKWFISLNKIR